jgi:hypothetical protein
MRPTGPVWLNLPRAVEIQRYLSHDLSDFADVLREDGTVPMHDRTYQHLAEMLRALDKAIDTATEGANRS